MTEEEFEFLVKDVFFGLHEEAREFSKGYFQRLVDHGVIDGAAIDFPNKGDMSISKDDRTFSLSLTNPEDTFQYKLN